MSALPSDILAVVCGQLAIIKRNLDHGEELAKRLRAAGRPVGDLEMQLAQLRQQYLLLKQQFPECPEQ